MRAKKVVAASAARAASKRERTPLQAEQRLQSVIELAADFYWEQDEYHRFTVYRPSREPDAAFADLLGKTSFERLTERHSRRGRSSATSHTGSATITTRAIFRSAGSRRSTNAASSWVTAVSRAT
jgi:hypothetical protein